ncbi:MAG: hypothetical protein SYC29_05485 [Planctomycetota bacterium]|nr:hypothetical protein [Planctomycetota bacterium]
MTGATTPSSNAGIDRRHLPVIAAAAATVAHRHVRLRRVAVIAAGTAAAMAPARGVRGRRVIMLRRDGPDAWVTRGRVSLMASHSPHLH